MTGHFGHPGRKRHLVVRACRGIRENERAAATASELAADQARGLDGRVLDRRRPFQHHDLKEIIDGSKKVPEWVRSGGPP